MSKNSGTEVLNAMFKEIGDVVKDSDEVVSSTAKEHSDATRDMLSELNAVANQGEKDLVKQDQNFPSKIASEELQIQSSTSHQKDEQKLRENKDSEKEDEQKSSPKEKSAEKTILGEIFDFFDSLTFGMLSKAWKFVFGEEEDKKVSSQVSFSSGSKNDQKDGSSVSEENEQTNSQPSSAKPIQQVFGAKDEEENEKTPHESLMEIIEKCKNDPEKLKLVGEVIARYKDEHPDNKEIESLANLFDEQTKVSELEEGKEKEQSELEGKDKDGLDDPELKKIIPVKEGEEKEIDSLDKVLGGKEEEEKEEVEKASAIQATSLILGEDEVKQGQFSHEVQSELNGIVNSIGDSVTAPNDSVKAPSSLDNSMKPEIEEYKGR